MYKQITQLEENMVLLYSGSGLTPFARGLSMGF